MERDARPAQIGTGRAAVRASAHQGRTAPENVRLR
jgi:hypothetical protein